VKNKVSIIGTVGVPANYGGFETLAENLVRYHHKQSLPFNLNVFCSAKSYADKPKQYLSAQLEYLNLNANGASSVLYDMVSVFKALLKGSDALLVLGVSGALVLPLVRLISSARVISNIDGIEWRREKWQGLAKWFLRLSEWSAVRFSHAVIADNQGIALYVEKQYGKTCHVIAYGGDHAKGVSAKAYLGKALPLKYAFALCRIEPENNVEMILEAFLSSPKMPLVFVGNWKNSEYGRALLARFVNVKHIHLIDPIYDIGVLRTLREGAEVYLHGHSAGGTNPSLVEMMHFGCPIIAYDCVFNRCTTHEKAIYFNSVESLISVINTLEPSLSTLVATNMREIANSDYTWDIVGKKYFALIYPKRIN
jgi:glycosyltransferase involved in cell wall biosynthesis